MKMRLDKPNQPCMKTIIGVRNSDQCYNKYEDEWCREYLQDILISWIFWWEVKRSQRLSDQREEPSSMGTRWHWLSTWHSWVSGVYIRTWEGEILVRSPSRYMWGGRRVIKDSTKAPATSTPGSQEYREVDGTVN